MSAEQQAPTTAEVAAAKAVLRAHGAAVRSEVLGSDYAAASIVRHSAYSTPLLDHAISTGWGTVWDRPGLSLAERCLVVLSAMAATSHHGELKVHVRSSLGAGVTPDQIREVLIQLVPYCGIAAVAEAMRTVETGFDELAVDPHG